MSSIRQQKASRLIQREMGEIFQREVSGQFRGSMISVTVVRISPDLKVAKVYLSIFGKAEKEEVLTAIRAATRELRGILGTRMRNQLRNIPELHFFLDDSLDYAEKIEDLLND